MAWQRVGAIRPSFRCHPRWQPRLQVGSEGVPESGASLPLGELSRRASFLGHVPGAANIKKWAASVIPGAGSIVRPGELPLGVCQPWLGQVVS